MPVLLDRRVVLFDLDGTITDPSAGIRASYEVALEAVGIVMGPDVTLAQLVGPSVWDVMASLGVPADKAEHAVAVYRERHIAEGLFDLEPIEGMADLVSDLDAAGRTVALATAKPLLQAEATIEHLGLKGHVAAIGSATLDRSRTHKADIVGAVLADLGHPEPGKVVMVGDRSTDVEGGRAHGAATVAVTWGYAAPGELEDAGADLIVDDVPSLRTALLGDGAFR